MISRKILKKYIQIYGSMSMVDFLYTYVGVNSQFVSLKYATHKDIKFLFSDLRTISFDKVDNDCLATGQVIFVVDCNHNVAPYLNPKRFNCILGKIKKK